MKTIFIYGLFLAILLLAPIFSPVYAQDNLCPSGYESLCKIDASSIGNLIQILIIIAIILSVFFLIWAGIKWTTSAGDKAKLDQARSAITASIIGLVISLLAYFIVSLITYVITGKGDMSLPIPKLV